MFLTAGQYTSAFFKIFFAWFQKPFTIDGFTFSFWQVILFGALACIVGKAFSILFHSVWDVVGSIGSDIGSRSSHSSKSSAKKSKGSD